MKAANESFQKMVAEANGLAASMGHDSQSINIDLVNKLQNYVSASDANHYNIMQALLYALLTTSQAPKLVSLPNATMMQ